MSEEREMKDRVKDISVKISDNMGYVCSGNRHWGARAMSSVGDQINFDRVYAFIDGQRRKSRMISAVLSSGDIMDIFFNHPNPSECIAEEYGFSPEDIALLQEECGKTRVRKEVASNLEAIKMCPGTTFQGRNIDDEIIGFAIMYNNGRIPYGDANVIPPDEMRSICDKVDRMVGMASSREEEEAIHKDFLNIMKENYGKRANLQSSKTILFHECAKTMLKYGIVPSENYREWGDQALALACMYRANRKDAFWAVKGAALSLFELSHFDEHPEPIGEKIVSKMEIYIDTIEEYGLPVGISIKYEFLKMEHHTSNYLFNILARLSEKTGRKKKKRRSRR